MISLIHPSRGRPEKALATVQDWSMRSGVKEFEYILSIDKDDPKHHEYLQWFSTAKIVSGDHKSLVEATNSAAKASTGDILVYLSDDFRCPDNWGQLILKEFEGVTTPMLLKVDDCLQKFHVPVLTIPMMNRALLNLLGYFFHSDFRSMHCDEHLYARCMKLGVIKFTPHLKFPHDHVSIGKAQDDDTYRRSAANWNHGVMMINKHRRLGFTE